MEKYEKLQRRADGACETSSGLVAILPTRETKTNDGISWFEFKATVIGDITRIEWPTGGLAIIEEDVARAMLLNGYAVGLTDEVLNAYNVAVDAANGDAASAEKAAAAAAAAAEKAAADKAAAEKAAAEKAAAEKAAAEKKAADEKAEADKKAADEAAAAALKKAEEEAAAAAKKGK